MPVEQTIEVGGFDELIGWQTLFESRV